MLECLVVAGKLNDLVLISHGKHVFIFNAIKWLWKYTDLFNTVNKKKILFVNILILVQKLDFTKSTALSNHIVIFFRYLYVYVVYVWTHGSKCHNDKSIVWGYWDFSEIDRWPWRKIKSLPLSDSCWRWWSAQVNDIQVASAQKKSCQQWHHFSLAPQILDLADVKLFARSQT